jgi:CzcA family heavy metal efflux pump
MGLFGYFVRHRKAILFTIAILALSGIFAINRMPISLFPDATFPRIVILADNGEEPAERMMVEVTRPLEEVVSSIPGVRLVQSKTSRGSTEISINLAWGSDIQQTLLLLQGRIANIHNELPSGAQVQAEQMTVAVFPIAGYSLTSDSLNSVALRDIAMYQIRPSLLRVPGVAKVEVVGGDTREFLVEVDPQRLAAYGFTIDQVAEAVRKTNFVESAGLIEDNHQLYLSLVSGLVKEKEEIGSIVVGTQNRVPVHIADVAFVSSSVADKYIRTTAHGRDAVLINILKQPTGSTVEIGSQVSAVVADLKLPPSVHFESFYDQADFIRTSILGTRDSILIGIALALVMMMFFLRSWRLTIVIVAIVPVTLAVTFVCLWALGRSINIMTLGGIAAAVGLIIDDAIVIIEHVFTEYARHRKEGIQGGSVSAAIGSSLKGLMPAVLGSTASTIVIHIPLAFLGGITGTFFASLSITMVVALLLSFLFSISLAPILLSFVLREKDILRELKREERLVVWEEKYFQFYERMRRRWLIVIPVLILIGAGVVLLYNRIGTSFMPDMDEGSFVLDYKAPPGMSLNETNRLLTRVEDILRATPEVESYSRRTGLELGFFLTEPNTGDFTVKLKPVRSKDIESVIDDVRQKIQTAEPELEVDFGQLMMDVIGDLTNAPAPVEIKLFGEDAAVLRTTAVKIKGMIEKIPGIVDAFDGIIESGPAVVIRVNPEKAARAGLTPSDVNEQLGTMVKGTVASYVQRGEKLIGIRVRYPGKYRTDLDALNTIILGNHAGVRVPLGEVAEIEREPGQTEISRERLKPMIGVTARLSGRDLGSVMTDVRELIRSGIVLPAGVTVEYGGVYQTQQESFAGLTMVALAAFLLVAIVLLFEFGEFSVPVTILIVNLLSLLGVFGALRLADVTFNISSFVGIIMIIGIVAENAIFILHVAKKEEAAGVHPDRAIVRAVVVRSRPILITTLAAVFALLPLALGIGTGAQLQQSLAIAVIGGFSVSSLLLFLALPFVYRLFRRT